MRKFTVFSDSTGKEGEAIYSHDAESAAEDYAEWADIDSAEYSIVSGRPETVKVIDELGIEKQFKVSGETKYTYSAEAI